PPVEVRVWGWIGAPGHSRSTRDDQHLFVNRRPIDNRGLNAALLEGYHNALMKGRYPLACLFLELDPAEVDVNIHPAKREVKFHRERAIRQFVATAIRDALRGWHSTPSGGPAVSGAPLPAPAVPSPPPAPADESTAAPPPDLFAPAPEFKPAPAPPGGGRK